MHPSFRLTKRNEHILLPLIAVVAGLLVGYGAILFRRLIEFFQFLFMGSGSEQVVAIVGQLPWYHVALMPVVGGLLATGVVRVLVTPGSGGHGVPEVMTAATMGGGKLPLKDGLGKMLASVLSIACGGSVGREGPVVHLGATMASWVGQRFQLPPRYLRTIVGCGAAAGIAASFNAPIAGVMFALEVVMGDYGIATFSPIVLSSVVATAVARHHLGDFPAFIVSHYNLVSVWEIPAYVGLGALCGVVGIGLMVGLFWLEKQVAGWGIPLIWRPVLAGLMVGGLALLFPQIMGVGYDSINSALQEELSGTLMLWLIPIKIIATVITLSGGFSGGIFTPVLFLGAMVGGAFGTYAHALFPEISSSAGAYAMVGMGAMSSAVLGAPITSILILFELTDDYRIMLALMVASIVASLVIHRFYGDSVFTRALRNHGINIETVRASGILRHLLVGEVMRSEYPRVSEESTLRELKERICHSGEEGFLVLDAAGRLKGLITFQDIRTQSCHPDEEATLRVGDLLHTPPLTVTPGKSLYEALRLLDGAQLRQVAVVDSRDGSRVVGVISQGDILHAYNQSLAEGEEEA